MKKILITAFLIVCALAFFALIGRTPTADARSTYYVEKVASPATERPRPAPDVMRTVRIRQQEKRLNYHGCNE